MGLSTQPISDEAVDLGVHECEMRPPAMETSIVQKKELAIDDVCMERIKMTIIAHPVSEDLHPLGIDW